MKLFFTLLAVALLVNGGLAVVALDLLGGSTDDPEAVMHRVAYVDLWLGRLTFCLPLLLFAAGDYVAVRGRHTGWRRAVLLWSPFAVFMLSAALDWGFIQAAYLRFVRDYEMGYGGVPVSSLYILLGLPTAVVLGLLNHGLVTWWQRRVAS